MVLLLPISSSQKDAGQLEPQNAMTSTPAAQIWFASAAQWPLQFCSIFLRYGFSVNNVLRKTEVEAVPRTKSRRVRCTNLGCAAFQENIDRDLNVATKNIVRAGRAKRRNEEKQPDLQHPGRHQKRMQWFQQHDLGLTFVRPRWKRLADSCPCPGTSAGVARSPSHM